jgi:hypothetical protein
MGMKKHLLLCLVLCWRFASAQDITPNPGFEDWSTITTCFPNSFISPDDWDNLNCESNIIALTCTRDNNAHSGLYDVRLETKLLFGVAANGIITTGKIIVNGLSGTTVGGVPSHERPDSIFGWYKFFPGRGGDNQPDTTDIEMTLFKTDSVEVGFAKFQDWDTVADWTRFSVPIKYSSPDPPDTIRWLLSSSAGYTANVGSVMYVDDLGTSFTTGISPVHSSSATLHLTTNLSQNIIVAESAVPLNGTIQILDVSGRIIQRFNFSGKNGTFHVNNLANGTYTYEFADDSKRISQQGMLIWMK